MGDPTISTARTLIRAPNAPKLRRLVASLAVISLFLAVFHFRDFSLDPITPTISQEDFTDNPDYWTWKTQSPFQSAKWKPKSTTHDSDHDEDELCRDFPVGILSRIQIVLKIGSTESKSRVDTHLSSVTRCISNLLIVSDLATEVRGHRVHDILADIPVALRENITDFAAYNAIQNGSSEVEGGEGWRLDRFKFLPMMERAKVVNPTADWFVFLETDTYMAWDNLFRFLEQFNPSRPWYMGSPSPGFRLEDGGKVWFAYGGAGFVISRGAMDKLTARKKTFLGTYLEPSLSERYMDVVERDCCGDSVLGFALYQAGITLTGLWPMFNAHALHGIPFDEVHWCQPMISLHKSLLNDMAGLAEWESRRDREEPLLYADLAEYLKLGELSVRSNWDNADWGGFSEPPESPAHTSLLACQTACHESDSCLSFTYDAVGHCIFHRTARLGAAKTEPGTLSAGWDNENIKKWMAAHRCKEPKWVKPSLTRIF